MSKQELSRYDLRSIVVPVRTALLVVDMQNDFCADFGHTARVTLKDVSACQRVVDPIRSLIGSARSVGVPVIWIKANYDPRHLSRPMLAKLKAKGVEKPYAVSGTPGANFYKLAPHSNDIVIEKRRHSAFTGTELDLILQCHGIETLIVTGVQTHVCVETTLRDGFTRGYFIVVPSDCVGSFASDLHDATLKCVGQHFGEVTTGDELAAIWSASSPRT